MRVGVLDSGCGGISILRALEHAFPGIGFVYYADYAFAPYSEKPVPILQERAVHLITKLTQEHGCDHIVIACNTLTVTSISHVRQLFPTLSIIGTVPPVKVAADSLPTGSKVLVLATKNTVQSPYLHQLIQLTGSSLSFFLEGSTELVKCIEIQDSTACTKELDRMIKPYAADIQAVVIGCTHFSFVTNLIAARCRQATKILEPQQGIINRCHAVFSKNNRALECKQQTQLYSSEPSQQLHLQKMYQLSARLCGTADSTQSEHPKEVEAR